MAGADGGGGGRDGHAVDAAVHTTAASAGKAMWLAGFCIYEANRFPFFRRDRPYLVLVTGALVCAILSAATAAFFRFHLFAHGRAQAREALAQRGVWVVRACFRYYISGIMLYLLSLTRVGYQYYPASARAYRWVPAVTAGCTASAFVFVYRRIVAHFRTVEKRTPSAARSPAQPAAPNTDSCRLSNYMHSQGGEISTLALFVANFAQAGITRFAGADAGPAAALYLCATCLAFACAAFAVFAVSVLLVFLYDLDGPARKEAFAAACEPTYRAAQRASLAALLAFNCAFALVGYGCGYKGLQQIPAALGYASLLALCFVALVLLHAALRDETELSVDAQQAARQAPSPSFDGLEARLSTLAVRSSIASGFVFYHLITFRTDIDDVETVYGQAFLALHAAAFALAITSSIAAHVAWIALSTAFDSSKRRVARCAASLVRVVGAGFWCSLFCFVAGFGLVGTVKQSTPVTTAAIAAVTLAAFAVAALAIAQPWRQWWPRQDGSAAKSLAAQQRWTACTAPHDAAANRLADQAFFFGSFGYYGCLFLDANAGGGTATWILVTYATCMGSSFTIGLAMVALTLLTHGLPPRRALQTLGRGMHHLVVAMFFVGFAAIGFVKDWSVRVSASDGGARFARDPRGAAVYAYIVAGGGVVLIVCAGAAHVYVRRRVVASHPAGADDLSSAPSTQKGAFSFSAERPHLAVRRLELSKNQLAAAISQASFCAGNVFFDVLFCTTAPSHALNVLYFGASTATFCLCAFVISAANDALLAVPAAPTTTAADTVHALARVAVAMLLLSQCAWLSAVALAGVIKDPACAGPVSLTAGGGGLLLMALHYLQIRAVSASVEKLGGSALARLCGRAAEAWTDAVATYRLWWRVGVLFVVVTFSSEAFAAWYGVPGSGDGGLLVKEL